MCCVQLQLFHKNVYKTFNSHVNVVSPRCYKNKKKDIRIFLSIWPLNFIVSNRFIMAVESVLNVSFLAHKIY